jgi:transposase-like protein
MIYTTNWIERLNKTIRRTQAIRNAFPSPESALTLISACPIEQENNFYLKYPITSFSEVKNILNEMFTVG